MERTYTGPQGEDCQAVQSMRTCNARGPLILHITKLFPKQVGCCCLSVFVARRSIHSFALQFAAIKSYDFVPV